MIRFYLDENVSPLVANQLRRKGIEVLTPQELGTLGDSDINHLNRATRLNCVLCTYDIDYLRLASQGNEHTGIVFGQMHQHGIGDWVNMLELIHAVYSADEMTNHIEYL